MKTSFFLAIWSVDLVPPETEKEGFWVCWAAFRVSQFWWLDRFCSIGGRCGSAGFAVAVSFAFLLGCLLVLCLDFVLLSGTQGNSLSCIGEEVTGTHFPSLGFWSSSLMSRMAVKTPVLFTQGISFLFQNGVVGLQLLQFVLKIFVLILQWYDQLICIRVICSSQLYQSNVESCRCIHLYRMKHLGMAKATWCKT